MTTEVLCQISQFKKGKPWLVALLGPDVQMPKKQTYMTFEEAPNQLDSDIASSDQNISNIFQSILSGCCNIASSDQNISHSLNFSRQRISGSDNTHIQ